jgi:ABC-2 type transport system ATP-binding protein
MNDPGSPALAAVGLGKRYGRRRWALRGCDFHVPAGSVCGLVGPNGAGKSTLLALAARLLEPSEGELLLFGHPVGAPGQRERLAYVAQRKPLYGRFTVDDMLRFGRELNPRWDEARARRVIDAGRLSGGTRVGSLSGGQHTRVALALALGKQADLLLLDEPMSDLDPLARHDLLGLLMAEAAEYGTTVVVSSHILSELEHTIDRVLVMESGRVGLSADVDTALGEHRLLVGPAALRSGLEGHEVVDVRVTGRQLTALVRVNDFLWLDPNRWEITVPTLEQLLLAYLRAPRQHAEVAA